MDILRLLEQLEDMVLNEPKSFGPITWGMRYDDVKMHIAKIRATLPTEIKQADAKVRESERIVLGAKEDASQTLDAAKREGERMISEANKQAQQIVDEAQIRQERMVAESEILKLAKAQADEIRNLADRDAVTMRRGAEKYAHDVLTQLENVAGKVINAANDGKAQLERPSPENAVVNAPRERIKV